MKQFLSELDSNKGMYMKFLSAILVMFFAVPSFATKTYQSKIDITTTGSYDVSVTKEVNLNGDAAKDMYNFLNVDEKSSSVEPDWVYKYAHYLVCGKNLKTEDHVCTVYLNPAGLDPVL